MWNEDTISLCAIRYRGGDKAGAFPASLAVGLWTMQGGVFSRSHAGIAPELASSVGVDPKIRGCAIVLSSCRLSVKIQEVQECSQEMSRKIRYQPGRRKEVRRGTRIISTDHQADERRTRNGGASDGRLNEIVTKHTDVGDLDCEVTSSTAMKQSDGGGLHVQSCRWKTCATLSVSCNVLWSVVAVLRFGLAS